jgi:uncharacterized protein with GYD domain
MAKYMIQASYTKEGISGVLKDGGSGRRDAIEKMITGAGGSIESLYFAFGDNDVYVIMDLPDAETAAAIAMTVGAAGSVEIQTTALLTPEQVDEAAKKSVSYRPPGG